MNSTLELQSFLTHKGLSVSSMITLVIPSKYCI